MAVQIPTILVVIACKTVLAGSPDQNAAFTHYENRQWATEHSMMVCRRHEIQLFDPAEAMQLGPDDDPVPALNANFALAGQCARAGIRLGPDPPQYALARLAHRLPDTHRGYEDRDGHWL
jgi:hypothetical protein